MTPTQPIITISLTIEEVKHLEQCVDAHFKVGLDDGLRGAQRSLSLLNKVQEALNELNKKAKEEAAANELNVKNGAEENLKTGIPSGTRKRGPTSEAKPEASRAS